MEPNESTGAEIQNMLKNFNPYEILEPVKVSDTKVDLLVDIDQESSQQGKYNARALEVTLPKINPDLVDLFENILVTPQQVARKSQDLINIEDWTFLDDVNKPANDPSSSKEANEEPSRNCSMKNKSDAPKILIPPSLENMSMNIINKEKDVILNSLLESNIKQFHQTTKDEVKDTDNYKSSYNIDDHDELLDEILQSKAFEMTYRNHIASTSEYLPTKQNNELTANNNKQINNKTPTDNTAKYIKLLDTVVKDDKIFAKRLIKSDADKTYTRGPSIYEKSLLLPQMMERLTARKTVLEKRTNLQRRLVLDAGSESPVVLPELNPTVLMADCNRHRLQCLRTVQRFEEFVKSGRY